MRCNPWRWLWGLIPIAILAFLTVQWEHERIEVDLAQRAQTALKAAGMPWAFTAFDGRDGLITGQASVDDAPVKALKVVREVWGVRVTDQRTQLLARVDPYLWSAGLRGGRLKLTGFVPNDETRKTVLGLTAAAFPNREVDDRLELARGIADPNIWLSGIGFGLKQLAALSTGVVSLKNTDLTIEGEAIDLPRYKSIRGALRSGLPSGVILVAEKISPPIVSPFKWIARRSGNQLQLEGFVSDEALREQIFAHAKKVFPKLAIVDRMEPAGGAPSGLAGVARAGLEQLALLKNGEVGLADLKVRIAGEAADEETARAVAKALRTAAQGYEVTDEITFPRPQPAPVSPYIIKIDYTSGAVTLKGFVPNEEARQKFVGLARKRFPDRDIRDELQLAAGEPGRWFDCVDAGLGQLTRLDTGSIVISDTKLSLKGTTREEALVAGVAADLRAAANRSCETAAEIAFDAPPEPDLTWRATHDGGTKVVLEGDVMDARTRAALVQVATRLFPNAQIEDRMAIRDSRSTKWAGVAELGLKLIATLRKGEAVLSRQDLLVRGEAKDTAVQTNVRDQLTRAVPKGYAGRDAIEVRSDAMIWAEQEAKRKAEATAQRAVDAEKRKSEASTCQVKLREIATSGTIRFDWASANLDTDSRPTLDKLAEVARACPKAKIEIEGHTDAEGTPERNKSLSERRARAVFDYLSKAGVGAQRLSAVGYGETRPVAPNDTAANRARNRRIEFAVSPE